MYMGRDEEEGERRSEERRGEEYVSVGIELGEFICNVIYGIHSINHSFIQKIYLI